jgi:hypothetical protein
MHIQNKCVFALGSGYTKEDTDAFNRGPRGKRFIIMDTLLHTCTMCTRANVDLPDDSVEVDLTAYAGQIESKTASEERENSNYQCYTFCYNF